MHFTDSEKRKYFGLVDDMEKKIDGISLSEARSRAGVELKVEGADWSEVEKAHKPKKRRPTVYLF